MNQHRRVINLFGGPGSGKSITCAALYAELKYRGCNTEMVLEYAKDATWEDRALALRTQEYIFGQQQMRMLRAIDKVDFLITDSPVLMSLVYHDYSNPIHVPLSQTVLAAHNTYDSINILLKRTREYQQQGRNQTYVEALDKDAQIQSLLDSNNVQYTTLRTNRSNVESIIDLMIAAKWINQ